MEKVKFNYDHKTNKVFMEVGESKFEVDPRSLEDISKKALDVLDTFKLFHCSHFRWPCLLVDEDRHEFIMMNHFEDTVIDEVNGHHARIFYDYIVPMDGSNVYSGHYFEPHADRLLRQAEPEEEAYCAFLLKKNGRYFDKKEEKLKYIEK